MRQVCCTKTAGFQLAAAIQIHVDLTGCIGRYHGRSHCRAAKHRLRYCRRFKSRGKDYEKESDQHINLASCLLLRSI